MDLLQLKYFLAVARSEHITRAAKELNIAQPSLSQTITKLERELGVSLFDRQGRNIRINESGRAFLERVERAFHELEEGKREAADKAGKSRLSVSLATIHLEVMPEFIGTFFAQHSEIHFRYNQGCNQTMKTQLDKGDIDLCITSPLIEHAGIVNQKLAMEELFLIVPAGHRFSGRGRVRLSEAANESFVCLKEGFGLRESTDEFCRLAGFKPKVVFEVDDPTLLKQLVKAGVGIGFIPYMLIKNTEYPSANVLHIDEPVCERTIGLAWNEKRELSEQAKKFKQYIIHYFERLEPELRGKSLTAAT